MKLSIIVPVFNEIGTIEEILKKIKSADTGKAEKEIIVVDDFSSDGTRAFLQKLKNDFKVIFHEKNKGKSDAIKTAIPFATGDYVLIQDADLEYNPSDYKNLLKCAEDNLAEVVYGSRRLNRANKYVHPLFYLGGNFLTHLTNFLYNANITDEATCYKLFKRSVIAGLKLKYHGFGFCPEVTAKILKKGIKIYEIPIEYCPRFKKDGKKIKLKDGLQAAYILIKHKFTN